MLDLVPRCALLRFEVPIHFIARSPRIDGNLTGWTDRHTLPALCSLEAGAAERPFATVRLAWNDDGLFAAFEVTGRRGLPQCETEQWWKYDGVRLLVDTRDARDNKRATRFCHFFYFLPTGKAGRSAEPVVGTHKMSRAKEPPPAVDVSKIRVASHVTRTGYTLEAAIPAECLNGWDPAEHPRIGVCYKVRDTQLGNQFFSATDDMGWNADPSTWATGVLTR